MRRQTERNPNTRVYPTCCTSAFCGRIECDGCRNLPILTDFKWWVARVNAAPADPIWSPLVYIARKPARVQS